MEYVELGASGLKVSKVAFGAWPISGRWYGVTERDSKAALQAVLNAEINFIDTAHMYGTEGESERLVGETVRGRRDEVIIATKGGLHWEEGREGVVRDGSRARILSECDKSLRRLGVEYIDLYYIHSYDDKTPIEETARTMEDLRRQGKVRFLGVSNYTPEQIDRFRQVAPVVAVQPPYHMLRRENERELLPYCKREGLAVCVYHPLYRGLLSGRYGRGHQFSEDDDRRQAPGFHGEAYEVAMRLVDELRRIAAELGKTVPQVVLNWTVHRPGVTCVLAGARTAEQVHDNAGATGFRLRSEQEARIETLLPEVGAWP